MAQTSQAVAAEWRRLADELRRQGYPVASRAVTERDIAADMMRVRREMERRAGKPFVSDRQRIGGGGGAPVRRQPSTWKLGESRSFRRR